MSSMSFFGIGLREAVISQLIQHQEILAYLSPECPFQLSLLVPLNEVGHEGLGRKEV